MSFYCGAAKEDITPPVSTYLYGYSPDIICTEIHDNLYITVIAFGNKTTKALLISCDICEMNTHLSKQLRQKCSFEAGIDERNIILACTHTHCAPNLSGLDGWGDIDRDYCDSIFMPKLISACKKAVESMTAAEICVKCGKSNVGINRREEANGEIILGQNPTGEYDDDMTVILIRNLYSKANISTILHYGCHGTSCGCSPIVTRDWCGAAVDALEKEFGGVCAFINGAVGDVGPRLTNRRTTGDITHLEHLGNIAKDDSIRIAKGKAEYFTPKMDLYYGQVKLPYQEFLPLCEVLKQKAKFKDTLSLNNLLALEYRHLCDVEKYWTNGAVLQQDSYFSFEQTVLTISDLCFIPYPFEMFTQTIKEIKNKCGYLHTLVISCANGYEGYLPTKSEIQRGGYEVGIFKYFKLYSLADNTSETITDETLRILKEKKQCTE